MRTNLVREWRLSRVGLYSVKVALCVRVGGTDEAAYTYSEENIADTAPLVYPAHTVGMLGECFISSIYFDRPAGDPDTAMVRNAVRAYNFQLEGGEFTEEISTSVNDGVVTVDLGNVDAQDKDKIIQGFLLAINSVQIKCLRQIN